MGELVTQHVVYAGDVRQKVHQLERAIKDYLPVGGLAVVFVETKRSADTLELDLHEAGVKVTAIHGDRSQQEREEALAAFKTGAHPVLVATDVAARGLDIQNVALVVNFDMPKQLDDYVHRIGRTGRAGRKGVAVAFVNERCTYLQELGDLLIEAKQDPPTWFDELKGNVRRGPLRPGGGGSKLEKDIREENKPAPGPMPQRGMGGIGNSGDTRVSGKEDAWDSD